MNYRLQPIMPPEDLSHLNPRWGKKIADGLARAARKRTAEEQAAVEARNKEAGKQNRGVKRIHRWGRDA